MTDCLAPCISRADEYWGDDHTFNATVFAETQSYWTDPTTINATLAANARLARYATSEATNPDFAMSQLGEAFSLGETAAYIIALGDRDEGTVTKDWVEYLFGKYQLCGLNISSRYGVHLPRFWCCWHLAVLTQLPLPLENERLPLELGWSRPDILIDMNVVLDMMNRVIDASGATPEQAAFMKRHGGFHAGMGNQQ